MKKVLLTFVCAMMIFSMVGCTSTKSTDALKEELRAELKEELKKEMEEEAKADAEKEDEKKSADETEVKEDEDGQDETEVKEDADDQNKEDAKEEKADADEEAEVKEEKSEEKKSSDTEVGTDDWKSMTFALDGTVHTMPFNYSEIADEWQFDLADYGYEDGYIMNKGDKVSGTIDLTNPKYEAEVQVGFVNNGDAAKDIKECDVWSFDVSSVWDDTYPEVVLPGGITWGSTKEEIFAVYGEPEEEPYRADELGYYVYEYYHDYTEQLRLVVYDDGGLKEIEYSIYE